MYAHSMLANMSVISRSFSSCSSLLDAIDAAAAKLTEVTGSVAQKMYAAQSEEAASGGDQAEAAAGDDAVDAVDAEFEEVKDDKN